MDQEIIDIIDLAIREDRGDGDHTSLASIPENNVGKAKLVAKEEGVIAGLELATFIFTYIDPNCKVELFKNEGDDVFPGDIILFAVGNERKLLQSERLVLNFMQRMSGIATMVKRYTKELHGLKTKLLDTRKTTPGLRKVEKWAVRIGGGVNHRMGLYDMIMLKENHIAYAGGIEKAIEQTTQYLKEKGLTIPIEIETQNIDEVKEVLKCGGVTRIMLDNYTIPQLEEAIKLIDGNYETEASGGINLTTIREIAKTGVDYVSVGALTHSVKSLDISMLVEM
jgi:nicotinate-nucleotide pyrophosphorylase (carboxylating)